MRRTLVALVCLAIPLAAACGGTSTHATTAGTSPALPSSVAKAGTDASTSSANAHNLSGNSGGSWCNFARQVEDSTRMSQDFTRNPKGAVDTANSVLAKAESEAPTAISNDVRTLAEGLKALSKALADANYDFTWITPAQARALAPPDMQVASQHIVSYDQQVCGVKD